MNSSAIGTALSPIIVNIVNPLIMLVFALAVLFFVIGIIQMIVSGESSDARKKGGMHMLWGSIGMFIMISAWGIIHLIANTIAGI